MTEQPAPGLPPLRRTLDARRRWWGLTLALAGVPSVTAACLAAEPDLALPTVLVAFLLLVIAVALVGGLWPALVAAALGGLAENWFFVAPTHRLTVDRVDDVVALLGGLVVAVAVATVVDRSARRAGAAERSRAETAMLASLSRSVLAGDRGVPSMLEQIRGAFSLDGVVMTERADGGERVVATSGVASGAAQTVPVTTDWSCGCPGVRWVRRSVGCSRRSPARPPQRSSAAGWPRPPPRRSGWPLPMRCAPRCWRGQPRPADAAGRHQGGRLSLRAATLALTDADRDELLATVDESADRLDRAGRQPARHEPAAGRRVSPRCPTGRARRWCRRARRAGPADRDRVAVEWADDLPAVLADPGLLERVVANLVGNAVRIHAGRARRRARPRDGDGQRARAGRRRGPGGAATAGAGVRAVPAPRGRRPGRGRPRPRGRARPRQAMGGTLDAEDTPGGGLTMVLALPAGAASGPAR